MSGCVASAPNSPASPSCCAERLAAKACATQSLFELTSKWETDAGEQVRLQALGSQLQVVAMFFTKCEVVCPLTVENKRRIESSLPEHLRRQVGFTLVSLDAEMDTPAELKKYRANAHLPADRGTLLRGQPAGIKELGGRRGINFEPDGARRFRHTSQITVLDSRGRIIFRQEGLDGDLRAMGKRIKLALADQPGSAATLPPSHRVSKHPAGNQRMRDEDQNWQMN